MALSINPQTFYDAATTLAKLGVEIDAATTTLVNALYGTGSMAGTSDAAKMWATSYDTRTTDAVDNGRKLARTLKHFAGLLNVAGYNHALANYRADINPDKGTEPTKPADVEVPTELCWVNPPAAGGRGEGLICTVTSLMEKIHVHIPDGDTEKLGKAADAWRAFAANEAVAQAESRILAVNKTLVTIDSPEMGDVLENAAILRVSAEKLHTAANQLATYCDDGHKKHLAALRKLIIGAITTLETVVAINLAVNLFADVITAGIGVMLAPAQLAIIELQVGRTATEITDAVVAADLDGLLSGAAQAENVLTGTGSSLDQVAALQATNIADEALAAEATTPRGLLDFRAPNSEFPPNSALDSVMNANIPDGVDCSEIAEKLMRTAGDEGRIIRFEPTGGQYSELQLPESGGARMESYVYHEVYTDGRYVYDPFVSQSPIPKGDYYRMIETVNPDLKWWFK